MLFKAFKFEQSTNWTTSKSTNHLATNRFNQPIEQSSNELIQSANYLIIFSISRRKNEISKRFSYILTTPFLV